MKPLVLLTALLALLALAPAANPTPEFWFQPDPQVARLKAENARLKRSVHYHAALVRRYQRVLRHDANVREAIELASVTLHVSRSLMWRRALCESHANPSAKNRSSGASGLLQFLPSTWLTTPFAGFSIWSPYASAMAGAWMEKIGRGGEWVCR